MTSLTFKQLSQANQARQDKWPGGAQIDLTFVGLELGEEAGEVQGAVKKIIRARQKIAGNKGQTEAELLAKTSDELADLVINASRIANALDIDLDTAIRSKFNRKSAEAGVDVLLDPPAPTSPFPANAKWQCATCGTFANGYIPRCRCATPLLFAETNPIQWATKSDGI